MTETGMMMKEGRLLNRLLRDQREKEVKERTYFKIAFSFLVAYSKHKTRFSFFLYTLLPLSH